MGGPHSGRRSPALPWTVRAKLAALAAVQRRDGSFRRRLFSLLDRPATANPRPDASGVSSADVTIDASRGLWARVFAPSAPAPRRRHTPPPRSTSSSTSTAAGS